MVSWIKLYRRILDNIVVCKDTESFAIWCYLLLKAAHRPCQAYNGGKLIDLKPGQLVTGRKVIAEQFNISESKVQRVLKLLEGEQLIEQQTNSRNRLITILNWERYQKTEHQSEQVVNNKRTTTEQQMNNKMNNKINLETERFKGLEDDELKELNIKKNAGEIQKGQKVNTIQEYKNKELKNNNINNIRYKFAAEFDNPIFELTKYLIKLMIRNNSRAKVPEPETKRFDNWCIEIDRMNRIDGYSLEEIKNLIEFSQNHSFWSTNILSTKKLREKSGTLTLQMKNNVTIKKQIGDSFEEKINRMKDW